ncbi:MAG: membrane protein insertase YidC [Solobacterium sp.]|nr:membrane protein insertase YidC [Solobacterium sp.]
MAFSYNYVQGGTEQMGMIFGSVMKWCYGITKNYGLAILLFTVFSKVVLLPVSVWVQKNSIKMVKLQPEINRIKARYFGDKETIADQQQALFKREKYNPMASIIPLILQIVLLMGVVEVIYHPLEYILNLPKEEITVLNDTTVSLKEGLNPESGSFELAVIDAFQSHEYDAQYQAVLSAETCRALNEIGMKFLGMNLGWIASVNGGVSWIAPLLAGLSAWLLAFAQNRMNVLQVEQSRINQYGMMALSVGISLYLGVFVAAGVVLYWIASNLLAIVQQYLLNLAINPAHYVDHADLEASREELRQLEEGKPKRKWNDPLTRRSREDYKRFFSIANKHLVFYSEGNGFYKYYRGTIEFLLNYTNIPIHYITSDPDDQIFDLAKEQPQIHPYYIDSTTLITLMMKMDADVVVMTMPDLENYQIKRSYVRKDVKYVYVPHAMDSLNLTMRTASMDHFDAILVTGKNQKEEIEATEHVYQLPPKELIECGYPLLDDMRKAYQAKREVTRSEKTILIAPSWQTDNIVDSCLDELLEQLNGEDYHVVVRPHPQHIRHMPERMNQLKERFAGNRNIEIQTDFSRNDTVFESDLMITDWSGIAYEYAYTTCKPVLFIDTPMKVMNPEYEKIDVPPINIWMREVIGKVVSPNAMEEVPSVVKELLSHSEEYRETIDSFVKEYVYHPGTAGEVGARYLIDQVFHSASQRHLEKE